MNAPEIRVKNSPVRCPYCKDLLEETRELVACAKCGARHHASCRAEHGRCAVCASAELLVYARESEPGPGAVVLAREGDALVYRWRVLAKDGLQLVYKDAFVHLAPRELSFTATWNRTVYVARGDKLKIREVAILGGRLIVTFEGGGEVAVATESIGGGLGAEDLVRLERAILEWLRV